MKNQEKQEKIRRQMVEEWDMLWEIQFNKVLWQLLK
jgi:hypothetical protein